MDLVVTTSDEVINRLPHRTSSAVSNPWNKARTVIEIQLEYLKKHRKLSLLGGQYHNNKSLGELLQYIHDLLIKMSDSLDNEKCASEELKQLLLKYRSEKTDKSLEECANKLSHLEHSVDEQLEDVLGAAAGGGDEGAMKLELQMKRLHEYLMEMSLVNEQLGSIKKEAEVLGDVMNIVEYLKSLPTDVSNPSRQDGYEHSASYRMGESLYQSQANGEVSTKRMVQESRASRQEGYEQSDFHSRDAVIFQSDTEKDSLRREGNELRASRQHRGHERSTLHPREAGLFQSEKANFVISKESEEPRTSRQGSYEHKASYRRQLFQSGNRGDSTNREDLRSQKSTRQKTVTEKRTIKEKEGCHKFGKSTENEDYSKSQVCSTYDDQGPRRWKCVSNLIRRYSRESLPEIVVTSNKTSSSSIQLEKTNGDSVYGPEPVSVGYVKFNHEVHLLGVPQHRPMTSTPVPTQKSLIKNKAVQTQRFSPDGKLASPIPKAENGQKWKIKGFRDKLHVPARKVNVQDPVPTLPKTKYGIKSKHSGDCDADIHMFKRGEIKSTHMTEDDAISRASSESLDDAQSLATKGNRNGRFIPSLPQIRLYSNDVSLPNRRVDEELILPTESTELQIQEVKASDLYQHTKTNVPAVSEKDVKPYKKVPKQLLKEVKKAISMVSMRFSEDSLVDNMDNFPATFISWLIVFLAGALLIVVLVIAEAELEGIFYDLYNSECFCSSSRYLDMFLKNAFNLRHYGKPPH